MDIRGINRTINQNLHEYEAAAKENSQKPDSKKSDSTDKTDKIQISSEAKHLNIIDFATSKIKDDFNKEVSADIINKLKAQIKSGSYKPEAKIIADAILTGTDS